MEYKISDVIKINHYVLNLFPYWTDDLLRKWDAEVVSLLMDIKKSMSQADFYRRLMKLSAILNDGHTLVYLPKELKEKLGYFPVKLAVIEDRLVVIEGRTEIDSYLFEPINKLNDLRTEEFLQLCLEHGWPNQINFSLMLLQATSSFLLGGQTLKLEFESGDSVVLPYSSDIFQSKENSFDDLTLSFELLNSTEGIEIVKINRKIVIKIAHFMSKNIVPTFYSYIEDYKEAEELIFDVRDNLGGNSGIADEIAQAFFDEPIEMEKSSRQMIDAEKIASATMSLYNLDLDKAKQDNLIDYLKLNHQSLETKIESSCYKKYKGLLKSVRVKILQNPMTYSSAENFIMTFDNKKRATLIGEKTAGSTGQPAWIALKTGGMFMVTAKKVAYPNGIEHHNLGINPDVLIQPTLEEKKKGVDLIFNYALFNK